MPTSRHSFSGPGRTMLYRKCQPATQLRQAIHSAAKMSSTNAAPAATPSIPTVKAPVCKESLDEPLEAFPVIAIRQP